jgi:hypothetical protein
MRRPDSEAGDDLREGVQDPTPQDDGQGDRDSSRMEPDIPRF